MHILKSMVGRKIVMSVTGLCLIAFIAGHLLGNSTLFSGPDSINTYAAALHHYGAFIWTFRLVMAVIFSLHVFFGIQLTLENRAAKPKTYAVRENIASTFAGRNMIWTGLLLGAFLCFHLLHFTLQFINPEFSASRHMDTLGRPDVFMMVVSSFRRLGISVLYLCSMAVLGLHLMHSVQSAFQTIGLNNERTFPVIVQGGSLSALLIFLGFAAFPIAIFMGLLK